MSWRACRFLRPGTVGDGPPPLAWPCEKWVRIGIGRVIGNASAGVEAAREIV